MYNISTIFSNFFIYFYYTCCYLSLSFSIYFFITKA
nr:MAG TPA: hypothetical protein [Caudoviricetes sp.]